MEAVREKSYGTHKKDDDVRTRGEEIRILKGNEYAASVTWALSAMLTSVGVVKFHAIQADHVVEHARLKAGRLLVLVSILFDLSV